MTLHDDQLEEEDVPRSAARVFLWGSFAAGALALLVIVGALLEVSSARTEVGYLGESANRSTFLIGDIGRQLARMQAVLLRLLNEDDKTIARRLDRVEDAGARIDAALEELEPLLSRAEKRAWPVFSVRLHQSLEMLAAAEGELRSGQRDAASWRLDQASALTRDLHERVDTLANINESESARLLEAAQERLTRSLWIVGALGLLLLVGGAAIWTYAYRAERARDDLEESLSVLALSNKELDIFAGRAAHDIRNLLLPVSVAARALDGVSGDPARVKRIASQLRRSSERAVQVLDGLLAFARGADPARSQTAFVPDELEASLEDLRPRLVGRDIAVDARAEEGYVACDPRLLRIVLSNLVDNAMKFSGGDRRGHVLVTGKRDGDSYCLEIKDDGPGIPSDAVARLFEPFYRVDGGRAPGTGLGLATVHRIVEAHGGSIEVVSELGDGALFRVRLPSAAGGRRSPPLSSPSHPST